MGLQIAEIPQDHIVISLVVLDCINVAASCLIIIFLLPVDNSVDVPTSEIAQVFEKNLFYHCKSLSVVALC